MRSVRLFDCLHYDAASWQVVAQDGTTLALKDLTTGRIRKVAVPELLSDCSYLPDPPERLPGLEAAAILETLDSEARRRAEFLHRHVVEVLTGVPIVPDGGEVEPRAEYDPRNLLGDRIEAKLAELRAAGTPMSERTLRRHLAAYRRDGVAGLVDGRKTRESSPTGRLDPQLVSLLEAAIDRQTNLSTGTKSRVIAQVKREAQELGVPIPSRSTLYDALANLYRSKHPFGNATTRRTQANRPDRSWGRQSPARPGELVEIDSTPLDLMVVFPDGSVGRVDLTVALDIATRTPCAAILRPVATKAVDAAVLLARALTPLPMQPGWNAAVAFSRSILPAEMIPGDDEATRRHRGQAGDRARVDHHRPRQGLRRVDVHERLRAAADQRYQGRPPDPDRQTTHRARVRRDQQWLHSIPRRLRRPQCGAAWKIPRAGGILDAGRGAELARSVDSRSVAEQTAPGAAALGDAEEGPHAQRGLRSPRRGRPRRRTSRWAATTTSGCCRWHAAVSSRTGSTSRGCTTTARELHPLPRHEQRASRTRARTLGDPLRPLPAAVRFIVRDHIRAVDRGRMDAGQARAGAVFPGRAARGPQGCRPPR